MPSWIEYDEIISVYVLLFGIYKHGYSYVCFTVRYRSTQPRRMSVVASSYNNLSRFLFHWIMLAHSEKLRHVGEYKSFIKFSSHDLLVFDSLSPSKIFFLGVTYLLLHSSDFSHDSPFISRSIWLWLSFFLLFFSLFSPFFSLFISIPFYSSWYISFLSLSLSLHILSNGSRSPF